MWLLKKLSNGTIKYLISEKKSYTIGRKNNDIVLEGDPSISRKHCTLHIANRNECPFTVATLTGVWIVDEQSKYGTYLKNNSDWIKINASQNKKLDNGSIIKFGLMENVWSLEFKPLIACVSGISTENKKEIEKTLQSVDGCLKNIWCRECSLVIVNELTLTIKVVLALIHGVPIVTPKYVQEVVECIKNQAAFPDYEQYRPEIKEILLDKSLVSLDVNKTRKELFKGKKFIIPTRKQLETLKEIILSAGGEIELLSSSGNWKRFAENNIIMIQLPFNNSGIPEEINTLVKEITSFLKNNYKRRVIPESEIAQAVAYASIEKFCNPENFWFKLRIGERQPVDLGPVIVEETPIITTEEVRYSPQGVVPCSDTFESELAELSISVKSQPPANKITESQLSGNSKKPNPFVERKRIHSPDQIDHESQKKKTKSESASNDESKQASKDTLFTANKVQKNKCNEKEPKSSCSKKSASKSTQITKYFQNQKNPPEEKTSLGNSKGPTQSKDFWNCDVINNYKNKRKISSESDESSSENPNKKKSKVSKLNVSKQTTPEPKIVTAREVVEVAQQSKSYEKPVSFPPVKKIIPTDEENDLTGFFEKESKDSADDLDNTIFSLTLISPAYLKEDGSLIDPPSVPVNIKRFKKQKIFSSEMLTLLEGNEDVLTGDWIEPHSDLHSISVA